MREDGLNGLAGVRLSSVDLSTRSEYETNDDTLNGVRGESLVMEESNGATAVTVKKKQRNKSTHN